MVVNRMVILLFVTISLPALICRAAAEIIEQPQNISAVQDSNATFHCSGHGHEFSWIVYTPQGPILSFDRHSSVPYLQQRGIFQRVDPDGQGTSLYVLASQQNNNLVVRCIVFEDDRQFSYPATLVVTSRIPADWAVMDIAATPSNGAVNGTVYSLTCNVRVTVAGGLFSGMTITWSRANSAVLSSDENPKLGEPRLVGDVASQSLTFNPVDETNTGEYICTATLDSAPGVSPLATSINVVLTSRGIFQLKMWPVNYCAYWTPEYAARFEAGVSSAVTAAIERHCDGCKGDSFQISQGEFSCRSSFDHVTYRAVISPTTASGNATTQVTSSELLSYVASWVESDGSFLHGLIRLQLVKDCPVILHSLSDPECPELGGGRGGPTAECISKCLSPS